MTVISATAASSPLPDTTGMLTLPAATPFTVMVIPLTDTVAFVLSADTARKLLSVAPSGWKATVSVVLCPFTTEELAGVTVIPVAAVTVLRSSAIDGRPTLVTFTVRVITSFAVTALPILLTQHGTHRPCRRESGFYRHGYHLH
ncbi:Hypothetical protein c1581 [Escherichia coli CFT073]|uniref:Uncharacterized protein n=1 Tax=Escherichia coli O6:H1 (strain CFT073 / ATCC 700928 / UPEC) TaxID=199310 RepID=A0A0H2V7U2_ECOL6|nr:Hypothetical protein c1581 [Escherichia coli CFT073]